MKSRIIISIVILCITFAGYYYFQNNQKPEKQHNFEFTSCGWIPYWDYQEGLKEIDNHPNAYTIISPFIFVLENNHTISTKIDDDLLLKTKELTAHYHVIPTVTNEFNPDVVSRVIHSESLKSRIIHELVELSLNYDGIDVDFEQLYAEDKHTYSVFLQDLSKELHKNNKLLTVTLHPKTESDGTWDGNKSQDWVAIGSVADYVRIMAYDFHWSTSPPGPLAPDSWIKDVTKYAHKTVPLEKLILGIGLYGYEWQTGTTQASPVTLNDIKSIIDTQNAEVFYNTQYKSPYLTYQKEGIEHIIWYENTQSLQLKVDHAKADYAGYCVWSIGGLPDEIYETLTSS